MRVCALLLMSLSSLILGGCASSPDAGDWRPGELAATRRLCEQQNFWRWPPWTGRCILETTRIRRAAENTGRDSRY